MVSPVETAAPLTNARGCVMSDTFWVQFFLFLAVVVKILRDEWSKIRETQERQQIKEELQANTAATIKGNAAAKAEAAGAKEAAVFAAETSASIAKTTDKIEERLNGGDGGLGARVAKNEARLESLEKGQRSHDEAIGAVARSVDQLVISFASFTNEVKKAIAAVPPAEIRGETGGKA